MRPTLQKIVTIGLLGIIGFSGIFGVMALYTSYQIKSRQAAYLMIKTQLSDLPEAQKKELLSQLAKNTAQFALPVLGKYFSIDLNKSLANFDRRAPSALQCTQLMSIFEEDAKRCLDATPDGVWNTFWQDCSPADQTAAHLRTICAIDVGWR